MSILYLLIPVAMVLMAVAIGLFIWTVKSGQYEDLEGPAHRILMDDDDPRIPQNPARRSCNIKKSSGLDSAEGGS